MKLINHWMSRWKQSQQFAIRTMFCITPNSHNGDYQSLVVFFFKFGCLLWLCWIGWKGCISWGGLRQLVLLLGAGAIWALKGWQADSTCKQWPVGTTEDSVPLCSGRMQTHRHRGPGRWKWSTAIRLGRAVQNVNNMKLSGTPLVALPAVSAVPGEFPYCCRVFNYALENKHFKLFVANQYVDMWQCFQKPVFLFVIFAASVVIILKI